MSKEKQKTEVLPTEEEIKSKLAKGEMLTSLERFILNHQPRENANADVFRMQLFLICDDYENRILNIHANYMKTQIKNELTEIEKKCNCDNCRAKRNL